MQVIFFEVHSMCHNSVNGIKARSNSKKTDKQVSITHKLYVGALSDLCVMHKLFIQQCGQRYLSS